MREQLEQLWQKTFGDTPAYTELFFRTLYDPERTLTMEAAGRIVSALYLVPAPLSTPGATLPSWYLCAAATLPEYRGRGYMGTLVRQAQQMAADSRISSLTLIPSTSSLFSYYERFGFRTFFYEKKQMLYASQRETPYTFCASGSAQELFRVQERYSRANAGSVEKDLAFFSFLKQESALLGEEIYEIVREGDAIGYLVWHNGAAPAIRELLCPEGECIAAAGAFLRRKGRERADAFLPADASGTPKGMLWPTDELLLPEQNKPWIGCMLDW